MVYSRTNPTTYLYYTKNHVVSFLDWSPETILCPSYQVNAKPNVKKALISLEDFISLNFLLVDDDEMILKTVGKCREGLLTSNARPDAFIRMETRK